MNARLSGQGKDTNPAVAQEVAQKVVLFWEKISAGYAERVAMLQPTFEGVKRRQEVLLSSARPKQQGGELLNEAIGKGDQ